MFRKAQKSRPVLLSFALAVLLFGIIGFPDLTDDLTDEIRLGASEPRASGSPTHSRR